MSTIKITLPDLGEGITEGELVKWLVKKGDPIKSDQPIAEVMTDKAAMEVPSPEDGVVTELLAKEGESLAVGKALLSLKTKDKTTHDFKKTESSSQQPIESKPLPLQKTTKDVLSTPFTRRLAKELNLPLDKIKGTGLAGRITKQDVLKHSNQTPSDLKIHFKTPKTDKPPLGFSIPQEENQERQTLRGIRKKIAEKMQMSKQIIPHFTLLESANMEQIEELKNTAKELLTDKNIKVTYLAFVIKALLQTVKAFPELNAGIDDFSNEIVLKKYYHFGFAADTPKGLLVPVLKNVDKKSLSEISAEIKELADKARTSRIKPDEMSGGTITITNIGSLAGEYATPIINPPETAILGMYRLFTKACWNGEKFTPKKTMNFSLTCDHRLIDGAVCARALKFFTQTLEKPLTLFL